MKRTDEDERVSRRLSRRGYEIFRSREPYPGERALHHHECYEVNLIWGGAMQYRVGEKAYHLTSGDILLIGPGEAHQPEPEAEHTGCERVVLWIEKSYLQQFRALGFDPAGCFDTAGSGSCLRFDDEATMHIGELLDRCLRERGAEDLGSAMMADTIVVQVLILINRLYRKAILGERRDRAGSLVGRVLEYINNHYADNLTLDTLANRFFISKYHLSREFGRIVGIPVHRYITQKRLVVAKQMLREGRPSSMVYQHCGFGDYSNFYRAFRGEYGVSPKAYAESLRKEPAWEPEEG